MGDQAVLSRYIGLQQGDPDATFDKLPKGDSRPALDPGVRFIDLSKASYEELMELAAASAANPFGEMLSFNPGVLPARLGYMTGSAFAHDILIGFHCWVALCWPKQTNIALHSPYRMG